MPVRIAPQLVRPTPTPPADEAWVHEVKHDRHRIIAYVERETARHGQPVHGWVREDLGMHCSTRESLMRSVLAMYMRREAIIPDTDLDFLGEGNLLCMVGG